MDSILDMLLEKGIFVSFKSISAIRCDLNFSVTNHAISEMAYECIAGKCMQAVQSVALLYCGMVVLAAQTSSCLKAQ